MLWQLAPWHTRKELSQVKIPKMGQLPEGQLADLLYPRALTPGFVGGQYGDA